MSRLAKKAGKLICAVLCMTGLLLSAAAPAFAEEGGPGSAAASFVVYGRAVTHEFAFDPDWFRLPADAYSHDLALLSLGLSLAAFRHTEHAQAQDDYLISFLEQTGFEQIETDSYRTDPTPDSIGYGIALRKMEDCTLVAVAVCGCNYGPEWAGNLTVGDGPRAKGFEDAAQKVHRALDAYLARRCPGDEVKLWISGFSRGAAVSNLLAADCTDSGAFRDVYAYTFATPATTRERGDYPNIFNILRKNDMVPRIPLADWGYGRFGTDLFLADAETDMDRESVFERMRALHRELNGTEMVTNPDINSHLRILGDYLYLLMPDAATYAAYLEPVIVDILTRDEGTGDALLVLLEALERFSVETDEHGEELKALRDYLGTLINYYYLQDGIGKLPADQWDQELGVANLFNEHFASEYLAMMCASDDPAELFSDQTAYIRLVIYGKADAEILCDGRLLKTILADGTELVDGREAPDAPPYALCSDKKTVITLPADRRFTVSVRSKSFLPQTLTYTGLLFSGDTMRAKADDLYSCLMYYGNTALITTSADGRAIEAESSDYTDISEYVEAIYSPTTAMRLENNSMVHMTISGLVNRLLLILVILLAELIVSVVLRAVRKKKGRKRNVTAALAVHGLNLALFTVLELAMWYFVPILTIAKFIPGLLAFLVLAVYAVKGYREYSRDLKALLILIGAPAAYLILESLLAGDFAVWKGILLAVVYAGFLLASHHFLWREAQAPAPEPPGAEGGAA